MRHRSRYSVYLAVLAPLLMLVGCTPATTRWDDAQKETRGKPAVSKEALPGSAFNKFFPKVASPFDLVYTQEKPGNATASLKKDGKEIAILTIFDSISTPDTAKEYKSATLALEGNPLLPKGEKGTAVLVSKRFQVTVRSPGSDLNEEERKEWLKKFDLDGLSKLE
jgi:hypothetical protein